MKTYSRDAFLRAKAEWVTYPGPLWAKAREACREWTIFPPSQEGQDWRDAPHPSQRVIVWFALEQRPRETMDIIRRAHSWSGVIDRIFAAESSIRRDIEWDEEAAELERRHIRGAYRQSMQSIGELLGVIADSAGIQSEDVLA